MTTSQLNLKELISNDGKVLKEIWNKYSSSALNLVVDLLIAFSPSNCLEICSKFMVNEIHETKNKETLFREDSIAVSFFTSLLKNSFQGPAIPLLLYDWLDYIESIPLSVLEIENRSNDSKSLSSRHVQQNAKRLESIIRILVHQINQMKFSIPIEICWLFETIRGRIEEQYNAEFAITTLCSLFFLRFFCSILSYHLEKCLSITSPHPWLFPQSIFPLSDEFRRKLHLVSKVLQLISTRSVLERSHSLYPIRDIINDSSISASLREIIELSCKRGASVTQKSLKDLKLSSVDEAARISRYISDVIKSISSETNNSKNLRIFIKNLQEFKDNVNEDFSVLQTKCFHYRKIEAFITQNLLTVVNDIWNSLIVPELPDILELCTFKYFSKKKFKLKENNAEDITFIHHIFEKMCNLVQFICYKNNDNKEMKTLETYNDDIQKMNVEFKSFGELLVYLNIKKKRQVWELVDYVKQSVRELIPALNNSPIMLQSFDFLLDFLVNNTIPYFMNTQLKTSQITNVQNSWEKVAKSVGNNGGEKFYQLLFERAPCVIPYFEKVNMDKQTQHIISILSIVVIGANNFDSLTSSVAALGRRHVAYKTKVEFYAVVIDVLIELLSIVLSHNNDQNENLNQNNNNNNDDGDVHKSENQTSAIHWNDDLERSWRLLLTRVSTIMIISLLMIEKKLELEEKLQRYLLNHYSLLSSRESGESVIQNHLTSTLSLGAYDHHYSVLELGVKDAWKRSKVGPLQGSNWSTLKVIDLRSMNTPSTIFDNLIMIASIGFEKSNNNTTNENSSSSSSSSSSSLSSSVSSSSPLSSIFNKKKKITGMELRKVESDVPKRQLGVMKIIRSISQDQSSSSSPTTSRQNSCVVDHQQYPTYVEMKSSFHTQNCEYLHLPNVVAILKADPIIPCLAASSSNKCEPSITQNNQIKFWNKELVSYAAYEYENVFTLPFKYSSIDSNILGDQRNLDLTKTLIKYGWKVGATEDQTPFDLLPLCIEWFNYQTNQTCISLLPVPYYLHIQLKHPTCKSFNDLQIHWRNSNVQLNFQCSIGGLSYSTVVVSHFCIADQIVDELLEYFSIFPLLVNCFSLSNSNPFCLQKIKNELMIAVLFSYQSKNIPILTSSQINDHLFAINRCFNPISSYYHSSISSSLSSSSSNSSLNEFRISNQKYWKLSSLISKKYNFDPNNHQSLPLLQNPSTNQSNKASILILYASERGNSERYAKSLKLSLPKHLIHFLSMDKFIQFFPLTKLIDYSVVIFVVSTYINGGPPTNATQFYQRLNDFKSHHHHHQNNQSATLSLLPIRFAIFGFGSSSYESTFCMFSKNLEKSLKSFGGKELLPTHEADELFNCDLLWKNWYHLLYRRLIEIIPSFNSVPSSSSSSSSSSSPSANLLLQTTLSDQPSSSTSTSSSTSSKCKSQMRTLEDHIIHDESHNLWNESISSSNFELSTSYSDQSEETNSYSNAAEDELLFNTSQSSNHAEKFYFYGRVLSNQLIRCGNDKMSLLIHDHDDDDDNEKTNDRDRCDDDLIAARSVYHLRIECESLNDFPLYAGDHIAIIPENTTEDVEFVANYLNLNLSDNIKISSSSSSAASSSSSPMISVKEILTNMDFQLRSPHSSIFRVFASFCAHEKEKQRLLKLSKKGFDKIPFYSIIDVFKQFTIRCKLHTLISLLPSYHQPRFYSISNSPSFESHNREIEIIVGVTSVDHHFLKKCKSSSSLNHQLGFCSQYLASMKENQQIKLFFRNSQFHNIIIDPNSSFSSLSSSSSPSLSFPCLSPSSSTSLPPLIFCAVGTGISTFFGFLKERLLLKERGHRFGDCFLIYGCRNESEILFPDLLNRAIECGVLNDVEFAFSRPDCNHQNSSLRSSLSPIIEQSNKAGKRYVQQIIRKNDKKLARSLMIEDAYFYYCGDSHIEFSVKEEIILSFANAYNLSRADAYHQFTTIKNNRHYIVDVWGIGVGDSALDSMKTKLSSRASNWLQSLNRKIK